MANNKGRVGFLDPKAKRRQYSWRPTDSHLDLLEKHRFAEEKFQPLVNRLLRRLAQEIEQGATLQRLDSNEPKEQTKVFRADPIVDALIEQHDQGSNQSTLDFLIGWAVLLPPIGSLQNADELMGVLRSLTGRQIVLDVVRSLSDRATVDDIKAWLWELSERGSIKLIQGAKGARLGDRNTSYEYLEISH